MTDKEKYIYDNQKPAYDAIRIDDNQDIQITPVGNAILEKPKKVIPEYHARLKSRIVEVPKEIYQASGIKILGHRIKSLLFTTDVALIKNTDAQSIIAVYPFTPQITIMQSIINVASVPVFLGVGGGTTTGDRSVHLAFHAEQLGAYGVVVNAPMKNEVIAKISQTIDIPVVATISSRKDDFMGKCRAGADIFNVSAAKDTANVVREIRKQLGPNFPIIATGGPTPELISQTIEAGANAITYTPPSSADIFAKIMEDYRHQ